MVRMNSDEYRRALKALDITQVGAADFLGASPRSSRAWAGGGPIPNQVALLLRLMVHHKITPQQVIAIPKIEASP